MVTKESGVRLRRRMAFTVFVLTVGFAPPAAALPDSPPEVKAPALPVPGVRPHAYRAPYSQFPSHTFQLAPRWHPEPEASVHFGLLQPILFGGFNTALDLRWGPLVVSYSHGQGLDYSATPSLALTQQEQDAGMTLLSPWTTGGGVGMVVLDELYFLVDVKVHRYVAAVDADSAAYTTVSVGGEIGYRFFVWRGFFAQAVVRYWPNVYTSLPNDEVQLGGITHEAKNLGFFSNVMLGWAFGI